MSKWSSTLIKLAMLLSGGLIGALLARWYDEKMSEQAQQRSEQDRTRYEQGLTPMEGR
jgi:hypothetical protein